MPIIEEEKCCSFIQRLRLCKNIKFGAVADIYMAKSEILIMYINEIFITVLHPTYIRCI